MDAKLFRIPTSPNYYKSLQTASPVHAKHTVPGLLPAPDSRFPGWAGPMEDSRLVTDYSPRCSKNVPAGKQYPTTLWMQRNGEEIINYSRSSDAIATGSILPFDMNVVPPPIGVVSCTRSSCTFNATNAKGGIGIERHEGVPELFGTFGTEHMPMKIEPSNINGTVRYEGGRNSLRGGSTSKRAYA